MTVLLKRKNGDIEEVDADDAILADGERLIVKMTAMDADNKLAAGERAKEAAWQRMNARVREAWKGQQTQEPPKGADIVGESYVGSGGRITTIARSTT